VYDAKTMSSEPVCRVQLPQRVPFGECAMPHQVEGMGMVGGTTPTQKARVLQAVVDPCSLGFQARPVCTCGLCAV